MSLPPAAALLSWYDRHARRLPFRAAEGRAEPYHVWLSEVMLQQTTVAAVGPRFARFLARWLVVACLPPSLLVWLNCVLAGVAEGGETKARLQMLS